MEAVSKLAQVQQLPPPPSQPQAPTPLLLEVQHLRQDIKDLRTALQQDQESQPTIAELKTALMLEIEQTRQEVQALRQELTEIKRALGSLNILVKMSAAPRPEEIFKTIDPGLKTMRKGIEEDLLKMETKILSETQGMNQEILTRLTKRLGSLPAQIAEAMPKISLFGR